MHIKEIHKIMWSWGKIKVDFSIGHVKRSMSDKTVFQNGHVVPDISKTELVVLDESMKKGLTKDGPPTDDTINLKLEYCSVIFDFHVNFV